MHIKELFKYVDLIYPASENIPLLKKIIQEPKIIHKIDETHVHNLLQLIEQLPFDGLLELKSALKDRLFYLQNNPIKPCQYYPIALKHRSEKPKEIDLSYRRIIDMSPQFSDLMIKHLNARNNYYHAKMFDYLGLHLK